MEKIKVSQANLDEMAIWKNLQKYQAWKKVCEHFKEQLAEADKIINTLGFDRDKMFSERDVAIINKNAILELIQLPEKMIEQLSGTGVMEEPEELDPWEDSEDPTPQDTPDDDL